MEQTGKKIAIAIDGHSSSGKSTIAKRLAKLLGYIYIDTGAMYRAVTLFALRNNWTANGVIDEDKLVSNLDKINIEFKLNKDTNHNDTFLNGENVEEEIRQLPVSNHVSPVATIGAVRNFLVRQQQEMGKNKGVVMDGRDIGTVVFPDAELKLFVTAQPEVRAKRRFNELIAKGQKVDKMAIMLNILERDHIDSTREISPLKKADDALVLDNSEMTPQQQIEWIIEKIDSLE